MKVLIHLLQSPNQKFFEALSLRLNLEKVMEGCDFTYTDKFARDVDMANFMSLNASSIRTIKQCAFNSIPTILWLFFANTDDDAKVVERDKHGKYFIPRTKREVIKMMDVVVVPTQEAKVLLRSLGIRVPVVIIQSGYNPDYYLKEGTSEQDLFRRYFRIAHDRPYTMSVLNLREAKHFDEIEKLAQAKPDINFYCFVSFKDQGLNNFRLSSLSRGTPKNMIISGIVPEDIFRQGLRGASFYLHLGQDKAGVMTLLEPMAYKVPLIVHKDAVLSDMINEKNAYVVSDFNSALYLLRHAKDNQKQIDNATAYLEKYKFASFSKAVCTLFNKIYMR